MLKLTAYEDRSQGLTYDGNNWEVVIVVSMKDYPLDHMWNYFKFAVKLCFFCPTKIIFVTDQLQITPVASISSILIVLDTKVDITFRIVFRIKAAVVNASHYDEES